MRQTAITLLYKKAIKDFPGGPVVINQNLKNKSFQLVTDAVGPWTTLLSNNINRVN